MKKYLLFLALLLVLIAPVAAVACDGYSETIYGSETDQYDEFTTSVDHTLYWPWADGATYSYFSQNFLIDNKSLYRVSFNGFHCQASTWTSESYTAHFHYDYTVDTVYEGNWKVYRGGFVDDGAFDYYLCYGYMDVTYVNTAWIVAHSDNRYALHAHYQTGDKIDDLPVYGVTAGAQTQNLFWYYSANTVYFDGSWYAWTNEDTSTDVTIDVTGTEYNITLDRETDVESCVNVTDGTGLNWGEGCGTSDLSYTYPYIENGALVEFKYDFEDDYQTLCDDRGMGGDACEVTLWCRDLSTGNFLNDCYYEIEDTVSNVTTDYGERQNPFIVDVVDGHWTTYTVTKDGYTTEMTSFTCPDDFTGYTFWMPPLAPPGQPANNTTVYVHTYWWNGVSSGVLGGVSTTINTTPSQTKTTGLGGTTYFFVPYNSTYLITGSKSGYESGSIVVAVETTQETVDLYLVPVGVTPTTVPPTTMTPTPTTTSIPGQPNWFKDRLVSVIGAWLLAALIIFSFMVGTAYYTGNGVATLAAGGVGFVASVGMGLIDVIWLIIILVVIAGVFAMKFGGLAGGGGG